MKNVLSSLLKQKPQTLELENDKMWKEIAAGEFIFDRAAQSVRILSKISKKDFNGYFNGVFFSPESSSRLDIALVSKKHADERKAILDQN